jgi:pyruvate dehydrogenase complex dehydrogenase (E1) component
VSVYPTVQSDSDPLETSEWIESLEAVMAGRGPNRARFLLARLLAHARAGGYVPDHLLSSDYVNTIPERNQPAYPGDPVLEKRISDIIRWNAAVMVTRANLRPGSLGGHISTFASSAELYDVAYNHFFRGKDQFRSGDQVYFQGHASPGIYARAFLEGRPETLTGWIDVIEQRSLSQAVATSTGVRHESPQAILFVSDEVRWHASHGGITRASLAAAVGQDAAGSNA